MGPSGGFCEMSDRCLSGARRSIAYRRRVSLQPTQLRQPVQPARIGVSRSGLSLLGALGLGELTASTPEQYVEIAVALRSDVSRLEQLRASLRARFEQSSLRDEKRFAAKFEELLCTAWQQHLDDSK
jgi:hypothetical protein